MEIVPGAVPVDGVTESQVPPLNVEAVVEKDIPVLPVPPMLTVCAAGVAPLVTCEKVREVGVEVRVIPEV